MPDLIYWEKNDFTEAIYMVASFFYYLFLLGGTIMVKINGELVDAAGKTVAEYLSAASYDLKRVAVERNGEIVPKSEYAEAILWDGDSVEVVSFVGGG